jgi:DNA processing protein
MQSDLLYQIALTLVPNIGPVQAKILLHHCEPEEIFHAKRSFLEKIEGIGPGRAANIKSFNDFDRANKEIKFMSQHGIKGLFLTDTNYPKRLLNCYDSPTLLFYKGEADLNVPKIVAIIGTRSNTDYGKHITEKIVRDLAAHNITVISGLAYGIDAIAHKSSLKYELPTVGVLAHGLDQIYPYENSSLAKDMVKYKGGLLTEFRSNTLPDRHNFPNRNRIVAGMCDATIVIETGIKGGSMITAELANSYNKDVFAIPGRVLDNKSAGCNELIRNNKAFLFSAVEELINVMGWEENKKRATTISQRELFIELSKEERVIVDLFKGAEAMHIDDINLKSGLSRGSVASVILNLELRNVMVSLPGKMYRLA